MNDTVFISRIIDDGEYHAIFIEKDTNSRYYSWLREFNFNEWDTATYDSSIESVKSFKKFNLQDLPRKWCPLYVFKENFYLYAPSDWGSDFKVMFSDSTIMEWQMEGPWGQPIKSFKRISKQQYQLSLESKREKTDLEIRILDTVNQIAVFKELSFRSKPRYFFMVVAEFAKNFPIIVNYCPMGRRNEFEFETPDFTKYLKK